MLHRIRKFLGCSRPDLVSEDDESMPSDSEPGGSWRDENLFDGDDGRRQQDPKPFEGFLNLSEKDSLQRMRGPTPDLFRSRRAHARAFEEEWCGKPQRVRPPLLQYPVAFATPPNIVRSYEKTKLIGISGGTMALAGFVVVIATQTMETQHRLKLKLKFFDVSGDEGIWTFFGPEVDLEPNGTTFSQPFLLTIPTCYVPINNQTGNVKIQANVDNSWINANHTTVVDRKINFSIREFTPLRFLMRTVHFMKTIAHMLYIRQQGENEYEVIWCFYDDLMETTLEVEKLMELSDFTISGISGTFLMRHNDVVKIALEIPDCDIEDPTRTIRTRDLWASDAFVQVDFNIKNLGDQFNITDMTGKITAGENEIVVQ